jgi:hypothetical protein
VRYTYQTETFFKHLFKDRFLSCLFFVGHSDPVDQCGMSIAQRIKGTLGITGLSSLKSPYLQSGLAPRCRLITSWSWKWFQGFSCSLMKVIRELGSERCETVRSLSADNKKEFIFLYLSTKGLGRAIPLLTNCSFKSIVR